MAFVVVSPIVSSPASEQSSLAEGSSPFWRVFGSTFITIFLAELGDKTQVTTLLISAQSDSPWVVFLGAGAALVTTSLLGVWVGQWLARRVSPQALDTAAGILLLVITLGLLWDIASL
jgi:putative Ca2+/H+ antiporter (TMEM165/GDT1 family)